MAKRKLSDKQKRRVKQRHSQAIQGTQSHEGNTSRPKNTLSGGSDKKTENARDGVIITNYGAQVLVETLEKNSTAPKSREICHLRANLDVTVSGDKVVWHPGDKSRDEYGVVTSIHPRKSIIQRPDSYGKLKPVAANVSQMLITIAIEPEPHFHLIDRYLVSAENHGIKAAIILNKNDLLHNEHQNFVHKLQSIYCETLGYKLLAVNAKNEIDDQLKELLTDETSIFVGQSGVGKSSLIQKLLPSQDIKIGDLSEAAAKGRHTTTHSCLYHFPWGGTCIDSPGIREFGMWHFDAREVINGFVDLRAHSELCRFRDCTHDHEPGCAIHKAIEQGDILPERYDSYQRIVKQLDDVEIKPNL